MITTLKELLTRIDAAGGKVTDIRYRFNHSKKEVRVITKFNKSGIYVTLDGGMIYVDPEFLVRKYQIRLEYIAGPHLLSAKTAVIVIEKAVD